MKIPQPLLPIEVAFTALAWFFSFMFCYHVKSNSSHRLELAITHRTQVHFYLLFLKVEKILKRSLDSIPSPSSSVKIQIMGGKVHLRCKSTTLLGNKLFVFISLLTTPSNVLPLHLKQTFPPIICIFTEDEGDGIESRLPFKICSTLLHATVEIISSNHVCA